MIMEKTRLFDDIKRGEIVRILRTQQYYDDKPESFWTFGIVSSTYLNDFFRVYTPERHGGHEYRIRRDGMNKSGKGAFQIAFRVTPEEMDHPDIQGYLKKMEAIKQLKKQLVTLQGELEDKNTDLFSKYPLPRNNYL